MQIIAFVSQKGGVGKSTLARLIAVKAASEGLRVKVADLDVHQGTLAEWHRRRLANGVPAVGSVEVMASTAAALKSGTGFDLLILDTPARASEATLAMAKAADLTVIPAQPSLDDLIPAVRLAHELAKAGVPRSRLLFSILFSGSPAREVEARGYVEEAGFSCSPGSVQHKAGYGHAHNAGGALMETAYPSLNAAAEGLADGIWTALRKGAKT